MALCGSHENFFSLFHHTQTQKIQTWPKIYPKNIEIQDKKSIFRPETSLRNPAIQQQQLPRKKNVVSH